MEKLRRAIEGKDRWNGLISYIELVEVNCDSNPNASLDGAKGIVESVSKTILKDKAIPFETDSKIGFLAKKAFESLPVFAKLSSKDLDSAKSILSSFETISRVIGQFRNDYGFFSHGQDLQAEKFDRYLIELAISSSDLLASFLITSHSEDLKDRSRVYYEENDEFNRYIDETSEEYPVVRGIQLSPSRALYSDIEAYKDELLSFINEKTDLIERLEASPNFVSTRAICSSLIQLRAFLTDEEVRRIAHAGIDNPQIYGILGHGYTRNLFTWVLNDKDNVLLSDEVDNLKVAFSNKLY